jgi:Tfp pilus assembly PilM family ATPase
MFSDKTIIGLDIGSESIKMVETIHNSNTKPELITYGVARHSIDLEGYWDSTKLRQISIVIEEIMNSGEFKGIKTVMSVQSKDVFVTTLDFEYGWSDTLIQNEINRQAQYFLPYPPDEMRLSWNRITGDPRIDEYTGKQRVIINALPDFVLENSKNLLEHINLDGVALENQTISQIRASLSPDTGNTVLMDIGGAFTTFSIIVDGVLRSSSHVNVGIDKIALDFERSLGVKPDAAEAFKRDLNLINLYQLPDQVFETYATLKSELDIFVEINKKVTQNPQKIIITGGGVNSVGLIEYFAKYPIKVYKANNLRNLQVSQQLLPYISPLANQLSTAIGLSERNDV